MTHWVKIVPPPEGQQNISLDTELKLDFAMDLSRISEDIIDGNLFQNITFHSTSGVPGSNPSRPWKRKRK